MIETWSFSRKRLLKIQQRVGIRFQLGAACRDITAPEIIDDEIAFGFLGVSAGNPHFDIVQLGNAALVLQRFERAIHVGRVHVIRAKIEFIRAFLHIGNDHQRLFQALAPHELITD